MRNLQQTPYRRRSPRAIPHEDIRPLWLLFSGFGLGVLLGSILLIGTVLPG